MNCAYQRIKRNFYGYTRPLSIRKKSIRKQKLYAGILNGTSHDVYPPPPIVNIALSKCSPYSVFAYVFYGCKYSITRTSGSLIFEQRVPDYKNLKPQQIHSSPGTNFFTRLLSVRNTSHTFYICLHFIRHNTKVLFSSFITNKKKLNIQKGFVVQWLVIQTVNPKVNVFKATSKLNSFVQLSSTCGITSSTAQGQHLPFLLMFSTSHIQFFTCE